MYIYIYIYLTLCHTPSPFMIRPVLQVKIWFQNRRMKWRNSKERELLSSGSSRDVTLPSKGNPNPDLSDVHSEKRITAPDTTDSRVDDLQVAIPVSESSTSIDYSDNHCSPGDDHSDDDDDMGCADSEESDDEDIDVS